MNDTVAAFAELWSAVPYPSGDWHRWSGRIRRLDADLPAALEVAIGHEAVAEALERLVESGAAAPIGCGEWEAGEDAAPARRVATAGGQAPLLGRDRPALDAAGLLLAAVDTSPAARADFERLAECSGRG